MPTPFMAGCFTTLDPILKIRGAGSSARSRRVFSKHCLLSPCVVGKLGLGVVEYEKLHQDHPTRELQI